MVTTQCSARVFDHKKNPWLFPWVRLRRSRGRVLWGLRRFVKKKERREFIKKEKEFPEETCRQLGVGKVKEALGR